MAGKSKAPKPAITYSEREQRFPEVCPHCLSEERPVNVMSYIFRCADCGKLIPLTAFYDRWVEVHLEG